MSKSILIAGGSFVNKGAEAMTLTVAEHLRRALPDCRLLMTLRSPYFDEARQNELIPVCSDPPEGLLSRIQSKVRSWRVYRECDAIVDVGGYQFGDPWGAAFAGQVLRRLARRDALGVRTFYMPQAWGPFEDPGFSSVLPRILAGSARAYVRDRYSWECIQGVCPDPGPNVERAHDIAWAFRGLDSCWADRYLEKTGCPSRKERRRVCVTPNLRVYEKYGEGEAENRYVKYLTELIRHLCSHYNAYVILLGHELRNSKDARRDDRFLCSLLRREVACDSHVLVLDENLSAPQVKAILGVCDLAISSRYHALIAALSQTVPGLAVGWSHKYEELMKSVGLEGYGGDVEEGVEPLKRRVEECLTKSFRVRREIEANLPALVQSAERVLENVCNDIAMNGEKN